MKILNWNTQADRHRVGSDKLKKIKERVAAYDADIICLTEAYPEAMPDRKRTIASELSDWRNPEKTRRAQSAALESIRLVECGYLRRAEHAARTIHQGDYLRAGRALDDCWHVHPLRALSKSCEMG